ncbi:MAG: hypothetical protein CYPHOPRED_005661 [Cyphobasidiales sp. Tagirdzhanova-0007]|nr:MAG: hypothetical protein CYPHOPRED_005661 [Cyphobasidiales sp. Tagirdzhanova-0007]
MATAVLPKTRSSIHLNNTKKQPTTPFRRISGGSLSALSASRSREADDGPALAHLAGVYAELSEAIEDLAVNFEALDAINEDLGQFNEGLACLLYGLRMNAYTSNIIDAPTALTFQLAAGRARQAAEEENAERLNATHSPSPSSPTPSSSACQHPDATFMTINEDNVNGVLHMTAEGKGRSRIASTGRSGASKTPAQRKKEALIKFAQPIVATLPIQYREQQPQRADVETVIGGLRQHPDGM